MARVNTQYLCNPTEQSHILQRLKNERVLVYVRPYQLAQSFHSAVLDVDTARQGFTLDELTPFEGHEQLYPGCPVHIHVRLKGIQVHMDTSVSVIADENGIALYQLPFPDEIIYRQRRRHFRALLNAKQTLPIVLPMAAQQQIAGQLVDISVGGMCSRIAPADAGQLHYGQVIHSAKINLPDSRREITCDLAVRCLRKHPAQDYTLVGSEITGIEPRSRQMIERFIAKQDRARQRHLRL